MRLPPILFLLALPVSLFARSPILFTYGESTRAIALESVNMQAESLTFQAAVPFTRNGNTRVEVSAQNVDTKSVYTVELIDNGGSVYRLNAKTIASVPALVDLQAVTFRSPDGLPESGDVLVTLVSDSMRSNSARIGIGRVGRGLPDVSRPVSYNGKPAQIVFDGNSLTVGVGASIKATYPIDTMSALLVDGHPGDSFNFGVSGQTTVQMSADAAKQIDALYDPGREANVLVAWEIGNDYFLGVRDPIVAYNHFKSYCQARKAAGWAVIVLTVTPRIQESIPRQFNSDMAIVNSMLRANAVSEGWADSIADVAADSRLKNPLDQTYYVDGIHCTAAGYLVVAGIVKAKIETFLR